MFNLTTSNNKSQKHGSGNKNAQKPVVEPAIAVCEYVNF